MTSDTAHTLIGFPALLLMAAGAWGAWGWGYAAMLTGSTLLAGIVYARTR